MRKNVKFVVAVGALKTRGRIDPTSIKFSRTERSIQLPGRIRLPLFPLVACIYLNGERAQCANKKRYTVVLFILV